MATQTECGMTVLINELRNQLAKQDRESYNLRLHIRDLECELRKQIRGSQVVFDKELCDKVADPRRQALTCDSCGVLLRSNEIKVCRVCTVSMGGVEPLMEGNEKKGGVNDAPTTPKQPIKPPAQRP